MGNAAQSKWQKGGVKRSLGNRYVSYRSFEPAAKRRDWWTVYKRNWQDRPSKNEAKPSGHFRQCIGVADTNCVDTRFKDQVKQASKAINGFQYQHVRLDDLPTITDELNKEIIQDSPVATEQKLNNMEREANKIEKEQKMRDNNLDPKAQFAGS